MKSIILLAFVCVVARGAEENNETMSGDGGHGECEMGFRHGGGMFNPKMFLKEATKICVDVRFPKEIFKQCKQCMKEEAKKSSFVENMLKGKFPEKEELGKFLESVEMCKLKAGGINNLDKDLTIDKLLKALMFEKWRGKEEAKEQLKQQMTSCLNEAQDKGYKKLINYHKCLTKYFLNECEMKNEEPGLMLVVTANLLTLQDESKCNTVKVPQDFKQVSNRCLQQAKNSMTRMPESPNKSTSKSGSREFMKSMKFVKHFMKEYMMKAVECCLTEKGMFNTERKTINVTGMTEYVRQFQGWDRIQTERDEVLKAITDCGRKSFEEDSDMMDSNEEEEDEDTSDAGGMEEERKTRELMKNKMEFEKCFTPKFAEICGINNEVSKFFYPMIDPEFMGELFKSFMEIGGKDAETLMEMLKAKLTE